MGGRLLGGALFAQIPAEPCDNIGAESIIIVRVGQIFRHLIYQLPRLRRIADNTTFNGPLGDRLQAVVVSTGTYAGSTLTSVRCSVPNVTRGAGAVVSFVSRGIWLWCHDRSDSIRADLVCHFHPAKLLRGVHALSFPNSKTGAWLRCPSISRRSVLPPFHAATSGALPI
jgi:hypothetical protein